MTDMDKNCSEGPNFANVTRTIHPTYMCSIQMRDEYRLNTKNTINLHDLIDILQNVCVIDEDDTLVQDKKTRNTFNASVCCINNNRFERTRYGNCSRREIKYTRQYFKRVR